MSEVQIPWRVLDRFGEDLGGSDRVEPAYVSRHLAEEGDRGCLREGRAKVESLDYEGSLNETK